MALSIKEKLENLEKSASLEQPERKRIDTSASFSREELRSLDAQQIERDGQNFILRQKVYSPDFIHGNIPIGKFLDLEHSNLKYFLLSEPPIDLAPEKLLFFDTETTGLAGGTGTIIFLAGIGYFKDEYLHIEQFLLPDMQAETAVLQQVARRMQQYRGIVTYNGKSYDLPLLRNRLILNRMDGALIDRLAHIDLLHSARRLWKKFTKCNLQGIETEILGFAREKDIPGAEIPQLYFQFLKDRRLQPLARVLKHNVIDILSMIAIMLKIVATISLNKNAQETDKNDFRAIFRLLSRVGEQEKALLLTQDPATHDDDLLALDKSMLLKRQGKIEQAAGVWQQLCSKSTLLESAFVELAKYYEHFEKDYTKALEVVERAMQRIEISNELSTTKVSYKEDWAKRRKRLLQKKSRQMNA